MATLISSLADIGVGEPVSVHNLTMFPLRGTDVPEPGYLTLDRATSQQGVELGEIGSGTVPEIQLRNRLDRPVLILDGEELVGAKQNRVVNLTVLVPAKTELKIPVSCVEQGRWHFHARDFRPSHHVHHSRGRAHRNRDVSLSLMASFGTMRYADQSVCWEDVEKVLSDLEVDSATRSLTDAFETHQSSLEDYVRAIRPETGQTGALFMINGTVAGMDLFDSSSTLADLLPKLAHSYALDGLASFRRQAPQPSHDDAAAFLKAVTATEAERYKAIGEGFDLRLRSTEVAGGGLEAWDRLIHLCAFPYEEADYERRMWAASARRRLWID